MRQKINLQMTIWEGYANRSFGRELRAISQRLDRHPRIRCWAAADLIEEGTKDTGRKGPSVDSFIRAAIIKQVMSLSYDRLAFEMEDALSVQAFTRVHRPPSTAALQASISRIKAATREKINRAPLGSPQRDGLEGRQVQYGHKLILTTGASGLVVDLRVHRGNPADSTTVKTMIERQIQVYGRPPRQTSFDRGYASKDNLEDAKDLGVKDVAFHKKRGLKVSAMAKSQWVNRELINFQAGIEGNISALKKRYGWYRCTWKGWQGYQA